MPLPVPHQRYDGKRGENGIGGWWISLLNAQKRCVGQERWWTKPDPHGHVVPVKQYMPEGPKSLPIWLFVNGDMYLGEWNEHGPKNHPVENGFGISYIQEPNEGLVYIGQWENGFITNGLSFWLQSCKIWIDNRHTGSAIRIDKSTWSRAGRRPGIPFTYSGRFHNGFKSDPVAVVTLKDGTTRQGPWTLNKPVGDWYHDHRPLPPISVVATNTTTTAAVAAAAGLAAGILTTTSGSKKRKKSSPTAAASASSRSRPTSGTNVNGRTTASTIVASRGVAIKQEDEVIELLDSSSDEALAVKQEQVEEEQEQAGPPPQQAADAAITITTNNADQATTTMNNNNNTDQEEDAARIQKIQDWLARHVIGNNPKSGTMKMYASSLYELGFESVEMIKNSSKYLTEEQVNSFEWMKPLHKHMLLDYLYGDDI